MSNIRHWVFILCWIGISVLLCWSASAMRPEKSVGTFVAIGLPHPLNVGMDYRYSKQLGLGISGGMISMPMKLAGRSVNLQTYNVGPTVRWHPYRDAMFLGLSSGFQYFKLETSQQITINGTDIPLSVTSSISSIYVTPHLGFLFVFSSGITLGLEFGAQISLAPSSESSVTTDNPALNDRLQASRDQDAVKTVENEASAGIDRLGRKTFPHITMVKFGWFF